MKDSIEIAGILVGGFVVLALLILLIAACGGVFGWTATTAYNAVMGASVDRNLGAVVGIIVAFASLPE